MTAASSFEEFFDKVNFKQLKAQKMVLTYLQDKDTTTAAEYGAIEGLLNLLDALQDVAVHTLGYNKYKVFNLSSGDGDKPDMSIEEATAICESDKDPEDDRADEIYYQPNLTEEEWEKSGIYDHQVYRKKENAQRDFPENEIIEYKNNEIEEHVYVD
jgi:hypothetical protein